MLVTDDDQRQIDVNPAACTLFGIPRDDLLKLRLGDVMDASVTDRIVARLPRRRRQRQRRHDHQGLVTAASATCSTRPRTTSFPADTSWSFAT